MLVSSFFALPSLGFAQDVTIQKYTPLPFFDEVVCWNVIYNVENASSEDTITVPTCVVVRRYLVPKITIEEARRREEERRRRTALFFMMLEADADNNK